MVAFCYDHNGLRTQKRVVENGITTIYDYTLHGKLITHMTKRTVDENGDVTSQELHFYYDAQSRPAFVEYNGTMYRYVHSLQGDIVGIVDDSGALVVEYRYDAWGRELSVMGSMATTLGALNPFRYRGYVFDEETGLYYLRSRYYNPTIGRFVNSDMFIWTNVFGYTNSNPINSIDPSGKLASSIIGTIGSVISSVVSAVKQVIKKAKAVVKAAKIGASAKITEGTISIDIGSHNFDLLDCYDILGLSVTSSIITGIVDARYSREVGKEFLFTEACMFYEVREHIHAYIFASGQRELGGNLIAIAYYTKQIMDGKTDGEAMAAIVRATASTDLREGDINDPMQNLFFGYSNSVRPSRLEEALTMYPDAGIGESYY